MSPYTTRVCFQGPPGPPGPPGEQVCFLIGMVCIPSFILLPWMPAKSHDIPFIISVPDSKRKCSIAERCFICTDFSLPPVTYRDHLVV